MMPYICFRHQICCRYSRCDIHHQSLSCPCAQTWCSCNFDWNHQLHMNFPDTDSLPRRSMSCSASFITQTHFIRRICVSSGPDQLYRSTKYGVSGCRRHSRNITWWGTKRGPLARGRRRRSFYFPRPQGRGADRTDRPAPLTCETSRTDPRRRCPTSATPAT